MAPADEKTPPRRTVRRRRRRPRRPRRRPPRRQEDHPRTLLHNALMSCIKWADCRRAQRTILQEVIINTARGRGIRHGTESRGNASSSSFINNLKVQRGCWPATDQRNRVPAKMSRGDRNRFTESCTGQSALLYSRFQCKLRQKQSRATFSPLYNPRLLANSCPPLPFTVSELARRE